MPEQTKVRLPNNLAWARGRFKVRLDVPECPPATAVKTTKHGVSGYHVEVSGDLLHDHDGQVLLLGPGHDANTTLHLAELIAKVPYGVPHHCTVLDGGVAKRIDYLENDHCCERFALADDWLRAASLQREGRLGSATARLMRSRDVVRVALEALAADSMVFLHPAAAGCEECDRARQSARE